MFTIIAPEATLTALGALCTLLSIINYVRHREGTYILIGAIATIHTISNALRICPKGCYAKQLAASEPLFGVAFHLIIILIAKLLCTWCSASSIAMPAHWPTRGYRLFIILIILLAISITLFIVGESGIYAQFMIYNSNHPMIYPSLLYLTSTLPTIVMITASLITCMIATASLLGITTGIIFYCIRHPCGIAAGSMPYRLRQLYVLLASIILLTVASTAHTILTIMAITETTNATSSHSYLFSVVGLIGGFTYSTIILNPAAGMLNYTLEMLVRYSYLAALLPIIVIFGIIPSINRLLLIDDPYRRPNRQRVELDHICFNQPPTWLRNSLELQRTSNQYRMPLPVMFRHSTKTDANPHTI